MNDFAWLSKNLRDLKFSGGQPPCGFESRPRHHDLLADGLALEHGRLTAIGD